MHVRDGTVPWGDQVSSGYSGSLVDKGQGNKHGRAPQRVGNLSKWDSALGGSGDTDTRESPADG